MQKARLSGKLLLIDKSIWPAGQAVGKEKDSIFRTSSFVPDSYLDPHFYPDGKLDGIIRY
jgi:hypothetical protein